MKAKCETGALWWINKMKRENKTTLSSSRIDEIKTQPMKFALLLSKYTIVQRMGRVRDKSNFFSNFLLSRIYGRNCNT